MDTDRLGALLERVPAGRWVSYGDVARALGEHPAAARRLNGELTRLAQRRRGDAAVGPQHAVRAGRARLEAEGLEFDGDRAVPGARLSLV